MGQLTHKVQLVKKTQLTRNVFHFVLSRPEGFHFTAGQAIEVTIDEPEFITDAAPFTLTGLNSQGNTLELIFKVYPQHKGMTLRMSRLDVGDELLIGDAWDSFQYLSEGVFIAGGSGVTPFVAILRELENNNRVGNNKLIFANKKEEDIFLKEELSSLLGNNFMNILSEEKTGSYGYGRIDQEFLSSQLNVFNQPFYLCGPGSFSIDIKAHLLKLGANENLIFSEY